jgi:DMSO/TMAO reductase YedYZ molybdopterin-dependent catalytic subunit
MSNEPKDPDDEVKRRLDRREFIRKAGVGTLIVAIGGGVYRLAGDDLTRKAQAQRLPDGRKRLPPGQKVLESLRPMGGQPGNAKAKDFRLRVHGEVDKEFTIDFDELLKMPQVEKEADVHCVTGWSLLGGLWKGVQVKALAERAGLKKSANFVIFESAHGYTANISLAEALKPNVMVVHQLDGKPFKRQHGAPVRSLVPDRYFWKSAKWLTGIRFVKRDVPGYWETRGYHNIADPWKEQRYG